MEAQIEDETAARMGYKWRYYVQRSELNGFGHD
jgi:hypothetical protein